MNFLTQKLYAMQAEALLQQEPEMWAVIERATGEVVDTCDSEQEAYGLKWMMVEYDRLTEQYVPKQYAVRDPFGNVSQ